MVSVGVVSVGVVSVGVVRSGVVCCRSSSGVVRSPSSAGALSFFSALESLSDLPLAPIEKRALLSPIDPPAISSVVVSTTTPITKAMPAVAKARPQAKRRRVGRAAGWR